MPMGITEIARKIGGTVVGDVRFAVAELKALEEATPDSISPLLQKRMLKRAMTMPGAVLATPKLAELGIAAGARAAVACDQPIAALAALIDIFHPEFERASGIHPSAVVDPTAVIHPTASIGPNAVVEAEAEIGEASFVGPGAVICAGCKIGCHVVIGPGAVIGAQGFGFAPGPDGPVRMRHVGTVVIEDFVEIGANTCVDRATLGTTRVGRRSKLDNLVQVGHNVIIGERALLAGQVGLAGSSAVGDDAMLGGKAGIADHVVIGARAKVAANSGVTRDVADDQIVAGYPALPREKWLRAVAWLARAGRAGGEKNGG
jgi:UDP-3-O-[3-hydroxymyristoyl] glucosamine N-acyltransferase